ncbi:hypothetical protein [Candidatus Nitrosotenuis cloacae]|uniref:hypothetical protein n=1 Tax=Candidatus Nitrosotenuis cloacae TaxID=1603555 RepID=UPI002281A640|nr:hypothetical protein [Candidatus Nitrosotenuis cloacae]
MALASFEQNLIRLGWISSRLNIVYKEFENIASRKPEYDISSVLSEYAILQICNFLVVRKSLNADFAKTGKPLLDSCLKPILEPILKYETPLTKIRNEYVAHMQNKSTKFQPHIQEIIDQYQFPNRMPELMFFIYCIMIYHHFVKEIFHDENEKAKAKFKAEMPATLEHGTMQRDEIKPKIGQLVKTCMANLKTANYPCPEFPRSKNGLSGND